MLGFEDAVCGSHAAFGPGNYTSPIWMDNVQCSGNETALNFCYFEGWGRRHDCRHPTDAGVVCKDGMYNIDNSVD